QREQWYDRQDNHRMAYVNGQLVATQDEAGKLDVLGQLSGFDSGTPGKGQVQVQQGENLRSLARRVYGNDQLWYVIADANGLEADASLVAGSTLNVPEVTTRLNDASTFKPYDPAEITGPTTPGLPYIPPPDQGCNPVQAIIMTVIAVVVMVYAPQLAGFMAKSMGLTGTIASGAFAGATVPTAMAASGIVATGASAVTRGVASAAGLASFSWRDVAVDGITSALSAGISEGLKGAGNAAAAGKTYKTVDAVNNLRELNALGRVIQGVGNYAGGVVASTVVGRDTNFSWSAVAATAVGSYVSAKLGGEVPGLKGGDVTAVGLEGLGQNFVDGAINASARRLFGLGRQDWGQIGLQALSSTLANEVAGGIMQWQAERANRESQAAAAVASGFGRAAASRASTSPDLVPQAPAWQGAAGAMGSGVEDQRAVVMDAAPAATAAEGPNPGRMDVYGPAASLDGLGQGRWTQDANGELVSQLPTLEVIAPPRRRENPIVAKNWAMQGVGVLRPEIFDQQYASRARAMGYSPEELDSVRVQHKMPRPYYATEEQARAFVRQDRLLLTKVMFAPVIAGLSGGAASASPLLGAVLSGYGMYSGGQRLATAETAGDYVLGSIEVVGSALGLGYATRQLTSANGLKELVWMPLGTRGNVTPLTQRTSGWDDFGVANSAPLSQAAIRARVEANIAQSASARASSNFEIHALNERVPFLDASTPADRAIVWSNARGGNLALADEFIAQNQGYLRLENTPGGQYLESLKLFERYPYEQAIQPWERLSARYATGASGQVTAFTSGASPTSVFQRIELPILLRNPNVTDIRYMPPPVRTQP